MGREGRGERGEGVKRGEGGKREREGWGGRTAENTLRIRD